MNTGDPSSFEALDQKALEKLQQALTASAEGLFHLMQAKQPKILLASFKNPRLNDDHLNALLKRRDLTEVILKAVSQLEQVVSSRTLQIALIRNPATPSAIVLRLLPHLHLFELVNLCYTPGITPDQKVALERAIIKRLPATELGQRLTLARRATADIVAALLKSGELPLVEICLNNPRLREVAILQFLNGATARANTISLVAKHPKWKMRPKLREAILRNNRTPRVWFTLFLPQMSPLQIRNLLASSRLNALQKSIIRDELRKRST